MGEITCGSKSFVLSYLLTCVADMSVLQGQLFAGNMYMHDRQTDMANNCCSLIARPSLALQHTLKDRVGLDDKKVTYLLPFLPRYHSLNEMVGNHYITKLTRCSTFFLCVLSTSGYKAKLLHCTLTLCNRNYHVLT